MLWQAPSATQPCGTAAPSTVMEVGVSIHPRDPGLPDRKNFPHIYMKYQEPGGARVPRVPQGWAGLTAGTPGVASAGMGGEWGSRWR